MPREARNAKRTARDGRTGKINPRNTEYFLIVTDAEQTEQNYLKGFQKSPPPQKTFSIAYLLKLFRKLARRNSSANVNDLQISTQNTIATSG